MTIYEADIFEVLPTVNENTFDLIVADPDYGWKKDKHMEMWEECMRLSKNWVFVYGDKEGFLNQIYPKSDQLVIWVKPQSSKFPKYRYYSRHEYIYIWGKGEFPPNTHSSQYSDVWTDIVETKDHEWGKSLAQMMRIVRHHSQENDLILDVCAGSGTLRKACKFYDRRYWGVEIDPQWCDEKWTYEEDQQDEHPYVY